MATWPRPCLCSSSHIFSWALTRMETLRGRWKHPFWMSCIPHLCDLHAMVLWGMTQCLLWWLCRPILNICWAKLINLGTMDIIFHKDLLAQAIVAGQRTFSLTKVHFTIHMLPDIFLSKRETMLEQQRSCHCSVSLQT